MEESMARDANVVVHFKDIEIVDSGDTVRDHLTARCEHLAEEFPETTRYEVTIQEQAGMFEAHGHVSGKKTSVAAHIENAENPRQAGDIVLDKVERELRKEHDKRIFTPRRKAQKSPAKRNL
jgi:ribosome-associated translation inhibitor RaiA